MTAMQTQATGAAPHHGPPRRRVQAPAPRVASRSAPDGSDKGKVVAHATAVTLTDCHIHVGAAIGRERYQNRRNALIL